MVQLKSVLEKFYEEYQNNTPNKLKIVDAYLIYILLTGILQFAYCLLVGTFPFNSFLSGFISTVSCFVLAGKIHYNHWLNLLNLTKFIKIFEFSYFQFVFVFNQIHKIKLNSLEFHQNEALLILFLPILSFILLLSTLLDKMSKFISPKFNKNLCISAIIVWNKIFLFLIQKQGFSHENCWML